MLCADEAYSDTQASCIKRDKTDKTGQVRLGEQQNDAPEIFLIVVRHWK